MRLKKFIVSGVNGLAEKDAVVFNQEEMPEDGKALVLAMSTAWGYLQKMQSETFSEVLPYEHMDSHVRFVCVFDDDKEDDLIYSVDISKEDFFFGESIYYGSVFDLRDIIYWSTAEGKRDPAYCQTPSQYRSTRVKLSDTLVFDLWQGDKLSLSTIAPLMHTSALEFTYLIPYEVRDIYKFIRDNYIITYGGKDTAVENNWKTVSVFGKSDC